MSEGRGWELWGIWGAAPNDMWMVGQNGVIVHYDGTAFTAVVSPTDLLLLGIWGSGPNDIWAVGINGAILHYDGAGWSFSPSPTTRPSRWPWAPMLTGTPTRCFSPGSSR